MTQKKRFHKSIIAKLLVVYTSRNQYLFGMNIAKLDKQGNMSSLRIFFKVFELGIVSFLPALLSLFSIQRSCRCVHHFQNTYDQGEEQAYFMTDVSKLFLASRIKIQTKQSLFQGKPVGIVLGSLSFQDQNPNKAKLYSRADPLELY